MELEKLIEDFLESLDIDVENVDLADFGQFLEDNDYVIYNKIKKLMSG